MHQCDLQNSSWQREGAMGLLAQSSPQISTADRSCHSTKAKSKLLDRPHENRTSLSIGFAGQVCDGPPCRRADSRHRTRHFEENANATPDPPHEADSHFYGLWLRLLVFRFIPVQEGTVSDPSTPACQKKVALQMLRHRKWNFQKALVQPVLHCLSLSPK